MLFQGLSSEHFLDVLQVGVGLFLLEGPLVGLHVVAIHQILAEKNPTGVADDDI